MTCAARFAVLLFLSAPAAAQAPTNLPGAERAAPGFVELNRRAAAAQAAFAHERAAYEAELARNRDARVRAEAAQARYRAGLAERPALPAPVAKATPAPTPGSERRCRPSQGETLTGSHVARLRPRRTC